jgi:hypothetical protein
MNKVEAVFIPLLLAGLTVSIITGSVQGASIEPMTSWINYTFIGYDSFYDKDVVAYEAESTAMLAVNVKNDFGSRINVSVVGISFDWLKPYDGWYNSTQTSSENPTTLEDGDTVYFTVNFTTPSVDVAHTVPHDYTIYVEFVNATDSSADVELWQTRRADLYGDSGYFVVFSVDQVKSRQMDQMITGIQAPVWNSTSGVLLWQRAMNESNTADYYYALGDFVEARVHYGKALRLIDEAFAHEESKGEALEEAQTNAVDAEVKVAEAWANFANGLSNMWTLIGVALVIFALGYIIRGLTALRRTPALR